MSQYGFYFDMTRCFGCRACQIACKDRLGISKPGAKPRRIASYEVGSYPEAKLYHTSIACNHCENPACVANCPTGAMFKSDDGIVLHDDDVCIGCHTCINSCPYEAPQADEEANLIIKCDSCKALRDEGMNPVCVDSCPARALDFGDMDELREKYGSDLVSEVACLPEASATTPNLLIRPVEAASTDGFIEVLI